MIEINDEKKMQDYCNKYQIQLHFTNWEALNKRLVHYQKGEIIALYGEKSEKLFILVKGTIRFSCITNNFEEYFFFDATNNGLFGEVEYIMDIPLITQSEVVEDSDCIVIPIKENRELLDRDLKFQKFVGQVLAQKYNDMRVQHMNIETSPLKIRLARYLCETLGRDNTLLSNLTLVAKKLRCSYRQLLREITNFCEKGYMMHLDKKGKYQIIDYEGLQELVTEHDNSKKD